jgi:hypothetical protein
MTNQLNHDDTLHELESLYHKSYQSSSRNHDSDSHDEDMNSESYGMTSSASDSSTEVDRKYSFVSRRSESLFLRSKKRRGMMSNQSISSNQADMFSMSSSSSSESMDQHDDFLDGVELFDADSLNNEIQNHHLSSFLAIEHGSFVPNSLAGWDTSVMEAEEWLDVLSFFCGRSEESKKYLAERGENGSMRRNLSTVSLPVC